MICPHLHESLWSSLVKIFSLYPKHQIAPQTFLKVKRQQSFKEPWWKPKATRGIWIGVKSLSMTALKYHTREDVWCCYTLWYPRRWMNISFQKSLALAESDSSPLNKKLTFIFLRSILSRLCRAVKNAPIHFFHRLQRPATETYHLFRILSTIELFFKVLPFPIKMCPVEIFTRATPGSSLVNNKDNLKGVTPMKSNFGINYLEGFL